MSHELVQKVLPALRRSDRISGSFSRMARRGTVASVPTKETPMTDEMRPLDPEVAELREQLNIVQATWRKEAVESDQIRRQRDDMTAFLASQGYARGEDGAWGKADQVVDANKMVRSALEAGNTLEIGIKIEEALDDTLMGFSDDPKALALDAKDELAVIRAQLAALRPVVKAAVLLNRATYAGWADALTVLFEAVRALPPEWRGRKP